MNERQEHLLMLLKDKNYLTIAELSKVLHYSPSTIRRDLKMLANKGLVKRTHGGAIRLKANEIETPTTIKQHINLSEKKYIAQLASAYVQNRQNIFIDSSSTANILARCLGSFKDLNIVTTNLETAIYLNLHTQNKISIIGGNMVDTYTSSMITVNYLMNYVFDISFMSCRGVSLKYGVTDKVESESNVKQALIKRTKKSILLVDSAKFGQALPYKDCELCQISAIVTNEKPDEQFSKLFEQNGVEIVY